MKMFFNVVIDVSKKNEMLEINMSAKGIDVKPEDEKSLNMFKETEFNEKYIIVSRKQFTNLVALVK